MILGVTVFWLLLGLTIGQIVFVVRRERLDLLFLEELRYARARDVRLLVIVTNITRIIEELERHDQTLATQAAPQVQAVKAESQRLHDLITGHYDPPPLPLGR